MNDFLPYREPTLEVRWRRPDAAVVVVVAGEHGLNSAADLEETLAAALSQCTHLIVDLSSADFVDSSIIYALVSAKKHADRDGRRFNLVLASTPIVERALDITGVLPILNRVETVEQALAR